MGQNGECPDGTFEAPNHACFKLVKDRKTFSDAEDSCASMGGHLAVINNSFVNSGIAQQASNIFTDDYWIGAYVYTRIACKPWVWTSNNELVLYTDWASGQPSGGETNGGQCVSASIFDGTWSATDCSTSKPHVCIVPRTITYCPGDWIYFNVGKACYKNFFNADWQDAENYCLNQSAHLASIHSQAENDFLISIARSGEQQANAYGETWIGLFTDKDDNSDYKWSDGSPVNYTNWAPGEPNNPGVEKCTQLVTDPDNSSPIINNYFNNIPCNSIMRNYVCKKPAITVNVV